MGLIGPNRKCIIILQKGGARRHLLNVNTVKLCPDKRDPSEHVHTLGYGCVCVYTWECAHVCTLGYVRVRMCVHLGMCMCACGSEIVSQ